MGFLGTFYKPREIHRFTYKPRYYDARKEERERRNQLIARKVEAEKAGRSVDLHAAFAEHRSLYKRSRRKANKRVFLIFAFLLLLVYIFFYKL